MRQLRIDGLTEEQCMYLDMIYACDSYEELSEIASTLPYAKRLQVMTLVQILLHESIEQEVIENMTSYPAAEEIIEKVKNGM